MTEEPNDKAVVEETNPQPKKPPGYPALEKLLKQVVNAPPMKRQPAMSQTADRP
jgi:hypothetical protein